MIPLETFPLVEWHYGELAHVLSFTVLKTQICVTRPQCVKRAVTTPTLLRRNPLFLGSVVCADIRLFCPVLSAACLRGRGEVRKSVHDSIR